MEVNDILAAYSRDPVGFVPMEEWTTSYRQENNVCGDFVVVYVKIDAEQKITNFSYQGDPAMHTLAAASLLTEYITGESVETVLSRGYAQMQERGFTVSTRRQRSAVTALLATRNALHHRGNDGVIDTYEDMFS